MQLTVMTLSDDIFTFEVSEDLELVDFKALCELDSGIPVHEIYLLLNGRPLHDNKMTLRAYGIKDGDMLLMQRIQGERGQPTSLQPNLARPSNSGTPFIDFSQVQIPGAGIRVAGTSGQAASQGHAVNVMPEDPATLRELLLGSPHDVALLKERNPPLADALLSGSLEKFTEVLRKQQLERSDRERDRIRLFAADPFDPDAQKQIAEEIRLKNVEHNMETAMEHSPESFGQVIMLYIDCMVNGHPVKAFVDSGAQMTIMSQACAERCNIMRLVDTRWAGIAKGVGTQKIIGRVHLCQIQIGPVFLQSSFSILEDQPMDMLLGLDMLKRHQCILDLKHNELVIGTTDTHTPFLSEAELPEGARHDRNEPMSIDEDRQLAEVLSRSAQEAESRGHATSSRNRPTASGPQPTFQESHVSRLMSFGFPRAAVLEELRNADGNFDVALAALLAKSIQIP